MASQTFTAMPFPSVVQEPERGFPTGAPVIHADWSFDMCDRLVLETQKASSTLAIEGDGPVSLPQSGWRKEASRKFEARHQANAVLTAVPDKILVAALDVLFHDGGSDREYEDGNGGGGKDGKPPNPPEIPKSVSMACMSSFKTRRSMARIE